MISCIQQSTLRRGLCVFPKGMRLVFAEWNICMIPGTHFLFMLCLRWRCSKPWNRYIIHALNTCFHYVSIALKALFSSLPASPSAPYYSTSMFYFTLKTEHCFCTAEETKKVITCCASETLCTTLPVLFVELEKCQKSLEGYLEQKRSRFPRFYFVSNPVLLLVLSQGSDPVQMQPYYEKVFDSISKVAHDKKWALTHTTEVRSVLIFFYQVSCSFVWRVSVPCYHLVISPLAR